jgi:hypothetical protein
LAVEIHSEALAVFGGEAGIMIQIGEMGSTGLPE